MEATYLGTEMVNVTFESHQVGEGWEHPSTMVVVAFVVYQVGIAEAVDTESVTETVAFGDDEVGRGRLQ